MVSRQGLQSHSIKRVVDRNPNTSAVLKEAMPTGTKTIKAICKQ